MPVKLLISITFFLFLSCSTLTSVNKPTSKVVNSLAWQGDKHLWVSQGNQIIRWNTQTKETQTYENISGQLLVDTQDNLWVLGTNIVHSFDGQRWQSFTPDDNFVGGSVLSYIETDSNIWLGTFGLSHYIPQSNAWEIIMSKIPKPQRIQDNQGGFVEGLLEGVHSIALESPESIWIGTNHGLTHITNDAIQTWDNMILDSEGVRCLLIVNNDIWACSSKGVGIWSGTTWYNFVELSTPIYIAQGMNNDIWVATWESGVARWDGSSWNVWTDGEGISGERITSFLVSDLGDVWVGTKTGISRWNGQRWKVYNTSQGLTSEYITVLYQSPNGTLWAGTLAGDINYYNPDSDFWYSFP
jgi:ligand-binding sensor domain-containing protein